MAGKMKRIKHSKCTIFNLDERKGNFFLEKQTSKIKKGMKIYKKMTE